MEIFNWYLEVLRKYAVFSGRARRKEFWFFYLTSLIVALVLTVLDIALGTMHWETGHGLFVSLHSLAIFLPNLAVTIRRLHDTDRSGWWILLILPIVVAYLIGKDMSESASIVIGITTIVGVIGFVVLLVFMVMDGNPGDNQYGPNPKIDVQPGNNHFESNPQIDRQSGNNQIDRDSTDPDKSAGKWFFARLMSGDLGLAKTFWVYGIAAEALFFYFFFQAPVGFTSIALSAWVGSFAGTAWSGGTVFMSLPEFKLPAYCPGNSPLLTDGLLLSWFDQYLHLLIIMPYVVYRFLVVVGIWKAASKYQGYKIWSFISKCHVVTSVLFLCVTSCTVSNRSIHEPSGNMEDCYLFSPPSVN